MQSSRNENGLADLEVALALIPPHDKEEYLQALRLAPMLILTESDPIRFLRFANYNAPHAALRLVRYWKRRRAVFQERAFLPFSFTGQGALSDDDIDILRSGVTITPLTDRSGRTLFYRDTSRQIMKDRASRLKHLFYVHQVIMENDLSQTEGYVLVVSVEDWNVDVFSYQNLPAMMNDFPVKFKEVHFVSSISSIGEDLHYSTSRVRRFIRQAYSNILGKLSYFVHHSPNKHHIWKLLEPHGIDKDRIPISMGGHWSYQRIYEWIESRKKNEAALFSTAQPWADDSQLCSPQFTAAPKITHNSRSADSNGDEGYANGQSFDSVASIEFQKSAFEGWQRFLTAGSTNTLPNDESGLVRFFWRNLQHKLGRLSNDHVTALVQAAIKAPGYIWQHECNPWSFILADDFNVNSAATRLAKYWSLRCKLFRDSEYMPLHQTGEGALRRPSDLKALDAGFVMLLPHDIHDCSVLFIDPSRLDRTFTTQSIERSLFYMFSLAAENEKSQQRGASVIVRLQRQSETADGNGGQDGIDRIDFKLLKDLRLSIPIRIKIFHIVCDDVNRVTGLERFDTGDRVQLHSSRSAEEIRAALEAFGLRKECLPQCFNGSWDENNFRLWQELRARVEWNLPLCRTSSDYADFPAITAQSVLDDKEERMRRLKVIHSWKKRVRSRIELREAEQSISEQTAKRKGNYKTDSLVVLASRDSLGKPTQE